MFQNNLFCYLVYSVQVLKFKRIVSSVGDPWYTMYDILYIFTFRATVCSLEDFEQKLNQVNIALKFVFKIIVIIIYTNRHLLTIMDIVAAMASDNVNICRLETKARYKLVKLARMQNSCSSNVWSWLLILYMYSQTQGQENETLSICLH